jgi:hypothetical protein
VTTDLTPVEKKARRVRTDEDYANDDLLRGLKVLEALQGTSFEAVSIKRIQQRTDFHTTFAIERFAHSDSPAMPKRRHKAGV